ncbi:helix-turn-helix domain-containing protein [Bacillus sp. EAC]|uniref:helix-turn-helix domain-containing protein n=1 Tax=Bacillus sp. EAC TaxID=1978338 RepID=UPI000B452CCB|nr:helix-turn-helix transcriptional regulator [Bacillus sp. EAC]
MIFGQRLKELREKEKLKPEELAEKIHFTKSVIWSYENGKKEPTIGHLIRLAEYFNVSTDYLLCLDNKIVIELDHFSNDNIHKFSIKIERNELTAIELKEMITYIKVKRIMEIEK